MATDIENDVTLKPHVALPTVSFRISKWLSCPIGDAFVIRTIVISD